MIGGIIPRASSTAGKGMLLLSASLALRSFFRVLGNGGNRYQLSVGRRSLRGNLIYNRADFVQSPGLLDTDVSSCDLGLGPL